MTPQDQGAESPAQEPALKPEELDRLQRELDFERQEQAHHFPGQEVWTVPIYHKTLGALIAQARTVPPAAAPVGKLREALRVAFPFADAGTSNAPHPVYPGKRIVGFIVDEEVAGLSAGIFMLDAIKATLAALAAAPVTGDLDEARLASVLDRMGIPRDSRAGEDIATALAQYLEARP